MSRWRRKVLITVPLWVRVGLAALRIYYRVTDRSGAWKQLPWPAWAARRAYAVNGPIEYDGEEGQP